MHINISKSETGNNKGSSGQLVSYLEKENRMEQTEHLRREPEYWFNHEKQYIRPYQVRYDIDHNIGRLSKDEAKFFLVNVSPSENELLFLKEEYGEEGAKQALKEYANRVMDEYAKNFKKEQIQSKMDILYFGKVEQHRYYTHRDDEVKQGLALRGQQKPGEQMHVQVIVSRKDMTNSIRLSPLNNSRGKNAAHSLKVGQFDRVAFKQTAEQVFDRAFGYDRELRETFAYANTLKHGRYEQRLEMKEMEKQEQEQKRQQKIERKQEFKQQQEIKHSHRQSQGLTMGGR